MGTKRGDAYALDAATGKIIWKLPVGIQGDTDAKVTANGSGPVIPGSQGGVEYVEFQFVLKLSPLFAYAVKK
jgi:outer membrane protein assembly factor BamB